MHSKARRVLSAHLGMLATTRQIAAVYVDLEGGRQKAMKQFLDEKVFKPGLGDFKR